jgi:signal-transduction protein with cAMP-binding, CBS, and nucleotidyltransferase domain
MEQRPVIHGPGRADDEEAASVDAAAAKPTVLTRIDSFPFRHRLSEVMTRPVAMMPPSATLAEAAVRMDRDRISSVVVEGAAARAAGIVTERDVLRLVAREGAGALDRPLAALMSSPVETLPQDVFVYRAIARMDRLNVRHLVVADDDGRAVGMITARGLLRQRAAQGLALADQIQTAPDAEALGAVRASLPSLARGLLAEDVPPVTVAALVAEILRDMMARAAELALAETGPAPARWCLVAVGPAARGEALLSCDQGHALVHGGTAADTPWFLGLGRGIAVRLEAAGVVPARNGVMASDVGWCRDVAAWSEAIDHWTGAPAAADGVPLDPLVDLQPVAGDLPLVQPLARRLAEGVRGSSAALRVLASPLDGYAPPIGWFGGFQLQHGRLDLDAAAMQPIAVAARVLAMRHGVAARGTASRLDALAAAGQLAAADARRLRAAHRLALGLVLNQQLIDAGEGRVPSSRVDVLGLDPRLTRQLKAALRGLAPLAGMVRAAVADA